MCIHFCLSVNHCNMYSYGRGLCISGRIYDKVLCMISLHSGSVLGFHNNWSSNTQGVAELNLDVTLVICICQWFFFWREILDYIIHLFHIGFKTFTYQSKPAEGHSLCFSEAYYTCWLSDMSYISYPHCQYYVYKSLSNS